MKTTNELRGRQQISGYQRERLPGGRVKGEKGVNCMETRLLVVSTM